MGVVVNLRPAYTLRGFSDGYEIVDASGFVASRVHGPNLDLAAKVLKALNEDGIEQGVRHMLEVIQIGHRGLRT